LNKEFWTGEMKSKVSVLASIALLGISAGAFADPPDFEDPDVTMELMPHPATDAAGELPEAVTKRIALPDLDEKAAQGKVDKAKEALSEAENRGTVGRQHGWSHADEARQKSQDMAEDAKARNENRSRGQDTRPEPPEQPSPPDNLPDRP
jgi:hypothetical protein